MGKLGDIFLGLIWFITVPALVIIGIEHFIDGRLWLGIVMVLIAGLLVVPIAIGARANRLQSAYPVVTSSSQDPLACDPS